MIFSILLCTSQDFIQLPSNQVPLLLAMKEDRLALNKAIDSGDTDLGSFLFPLVSILR